MFALAGQLKRLEEEAMKKHHVQEPYSAHHPTLPPPSTVSRTLSASTETSISPGASPRFTEKSVREESGGDKAKLNEGAVGAVGAIKPNTEVNYGKPTPNLFVVLHQRR